MKQLPESWWDKPSEKPKKNGESSEYLKAKKEAVDAAKEKEARLASLMEKQESRDFFSDSGEFPQKNPETRDNPERTDLQKTFTAILTDHVHYPFFRRQFPNFIRVCEESRLGKNIGRDILALAFGVAESLAAVVTFSGHVAADIGELIVSPRAAFQRTKNMIS